MKNVGIQTFQIRWVMVGFAFSAVKEKPQISQVEESLSGVAYMLRDEDAVLGT